MFRVLRRRLRHEEEGFSLVEAVVAMGVIFMSLTVLASTAMVGFQGAAVARQRQAATALANQLLEQVRALPFSTITDGLRDSDIATDTTNITSCSGSYKLDSCSGETIINSSAASTAPLYPHTGTYGPTAGVPTALHWGVYVTRAAGVYATTAAKATVYRVTVRVSWTVGRTSSVEVETLLSNPESSADSSTTTSSGSVPAYYNGTASISAGSVKITPNAAVTSGIGITGLTSSYWNLGDSLTQGLYSADAEVAEGQVIKSKGQSTLTVAQKSISGSTCTTTATHCSGGATVFSTADNDATSTDIGATSSPTAISQTGASMTIGPGSGNSLTNSQYTETTTTTADVVTKRSSSSGTSGNGSVTVSQPAGLTLNDLMILQVSYQGSCGMSTPSGWTAVRCDPNGSSISSSLFYKRATASDVSSWNGSFSTGNNNSGTVAGITAYSGVDPTDTAPINASDASTGTSTTASTPTLSVTTANARLVGFFAARGFTTVTPVQPASGVTGWAQNWTGIGGTTTNTANAGKAVGGASAGGNKNPPGAGQSAVAWTATLSPSANTVTCCGANPAWVAQIIALKPGNITNTTTTPGEAGPETGSSVSTMTAATSPVCGSPAQTDGKPCAYSTQSYTVPSTVTNQFLSTTVDLTGSGLGTCQLYALNPPSTNPTTYVWARRLISSSNERIQGYGKRYQGVHTFGRLCTGTGSVSAWPGYFVKYDGGATPAEATAQGGVNGSPSSSATTGGTIYIYDGDSTPTSFAVPSSGTWSTQPTTVGFTTSTGYRYDITATLRSGQTYYQSVGTTSGNEAKAVVGAPVMGTITYKLTKPATSQTLIDVTMTIDLGTMTAYAKYTPAA